MPHFAELNERNEVVRVIVADSLAWCQTRLGGNWIQTSYNATVRKNYAGIGYTYRDDIDAFVSPQPILNFTLSAQARWEFPITTDCIYVPTTIDAAYALSRALFGLINPGSEGMYCGVIPHPERLDVATLQLRTTDNVPVALGALVAILSPFVAQGLLTQEEIDGILSGISAMAGKTIPMQSLIPPSWQPYVMDRATAVSQGWIAE